MTKPALPALLSALALAACASEAPPAPPPPSEASPPAPRREYALADLRVPDTPVSLPAPEAPKSPPTEAAALAAITAANREGLDLPTPSCFTGKACTYWYHPDKQFRVQMAEGNQTLACLRPGERVLDVVAPGEQVWLPHSVFGFGPEEGRTECVAFMPRRAGLRHQVSVFTDQRKYDLDIRTGSGPHHVEVRWRYPEDVLAALNGRPAATPAATLASPAALATTRLRRCAYALDGSDPPWRPAVTADGQPPVCDDGQATLVQFPPGVLGGQGAPSVWRLEGDSRVPVQYARRGDAYVVAGVHDWLLLALGETEIRVTRRALP